MELGDPVYVDTAIRRWQALRATTRFTAGPRRVSLMMSKRSFAMADDEKDSPEPKVGYRQATSPNPGSVRSVGQPEEAGP